MGEHDDRLHNHTGPGPVLTTDPAAGLVHTWAEKLVEKLNRLHAAVESVKQRDDWYDTVVFSATPTTWKTRGYRHGRILLAASAALTIDTPIGSFAWNLLAGWNVVDLPEGATITAASDTPAYIHLTDSNVGAAWHA